MIRHVSEFAVTDNLRETSLGEGDAFPFSASELSVIEYVNNCAKWHWHDFVEFTLVMAGEVECCTPRGAFTVGAGEGYYVNASVLHMIRMAPGAADAKYRVLQFETGLLGYAGGVARRYVTPIEKCGAIEAFRLSPEAPEQRAVLEAMAGLLDIAEREPPCYELIALGQIAGLWARLHGAVAPILEQGGTAVSDTAAARVKVMLAFIHERCAEPMTVEDIAAAASVSAREAFRAFQQVLGTTPTLYVLRHRVSRGARLLMETDRSVTDISADCGFGSASYFCKAFHDTTGLSPREFRKRSRV